MKLKYKNKTNTYALDSKFFFYIWVNNFKMLILKVAKQCIF